MTAADQAHLGTGSLAPALQRELYGWTALAVGALAIAGIYAFLLGVSRVPGIEAVFPWPVGFFHKSLVVHVVFSFVIWLLAMFGALGALSVAREEAPSGSAAGIASVWLMAAAFPLLFAPAFLDRGEASLNNYVPAIIDPVYYTGLIVVALSALLSAARVIGTVGSSAPRHSDPLVRAAVAAGVIALLAIVSFAIAAALLWGETPSPAFNEDLFWGGGHVLQALNTLLILMAWCRLAGNDTPARTGRALSVAALWLVLVALAAPVIYAVSDPFSVNQYRAFTALQYLLGPPAILVAAALLRDRHGSLAWHNPGHLALILSMALFALGGTLGLFIDGADTRTPAHYHGVIGAVTLALMGMVMLVVLPGLNRPAARDRTVRIQVYCFAGGQAAACLGLFLAGGYGAPRKVAGAAQGLEHIGAHIGMALNGIGMLFAVAGGAIFVWLAGRALLRRPSVGEAGRNTGAVLPQGRPGTEAP